MKKKTSVDDLTVDDFKSFFSVYEEKLRAIVREEAKKAYKEIISEREKALPNLPPVFQDVLKEGLLNDAPVNSKYTKRAGIKDMDIIKHIIDNSGYADSLTADLYIQYIQVTIKPNSIDQYISRARHEAK